MKKIGFTLAEMLLVIVILGVIVIITASIVNNSSIDDKKLQAITKVFYNNVENTFVEIVSYETKNKGVKNLTPTELMTNFVTYMDGIHIKDAEGNVGNCSDFVIAQENNKYLKQEIIENENPDNIDENPDNPINPDIDQNIDENPDSPEESAETDQTVVTNLKCASFPNNIIAGFYINSDCAEEVSVKEYRNENENSRNINNACGYIIYEPKNSTGILGKDLFIIGFGNRNLK